MVVESHYIEKISSPQLEPVAAQSSSAAHHIGVFICYRRSDGAECAKWIYQLLDRQIYEDADGCLSRLDIYFDQSTAGVADWKAHHLPSLQSAKAFLIICTPGIAKDFSSRKEVDWAYLELRWWLKNRSTPPIVIDATGEGTRWMPRLLVHRWPDVNRLSMHRTAVSAGPPSLSPIVAEELRQRIFRTIAESGRATTFEDLTRYKRLTHRLSFVSLLLLLASFAAATGWYKARRNMQLAHIQETLAETQERIADEAKSFMVSLFEAADPEDPKNESATAGELLTKARQSVRRLHDDTHLKTSLLQAIGAAYTGLGQYDTALPLLKEANRTAASADLSPRERMKLEQALGDAYLYKEYFGAASAHLESAFKISGGPGISMADKATVLVSMGDYESWRPDHDYAKADLQYLKALKLDSEPENRPAMLRDVTRLTSLALVREDFMAATSRCVPAIQMAQRSTNRSAELQLAQLRNDCAKALYAQGRLSEAEKEYTAAIEVLTSFYGPGNGEVAVAQNNLARVLIEQDRSSEAKHPLLSAIKTQTQRFGSQYSLLSYSLNNMGLVLRSSGDVPQARKAFFDALKIAKRSNVPIGAQTLVHLGEMELQEGKLKQAAEYFSAADAYFANDNVKSGWRYALLQSAKGELDVRTCNFGNAKTALAESGKELVKRWPEENLFVRAAARRQILLETALQSTGNCR